MARYGLPTYPLYDGMTIGRRDADELEWLLEHGVFQTDIYQYNKIVKVSATEYHLFYMEDSRYTNEEKDLGSTSSLQELLTKGKFDISYWRWFGK
jgi:hypothetical protein